RGALESSLESLRQALRIRRSAGAPAAIAAALFEQASVLHASGRDGPAHPLLLEAQELLVPPDGTDAGAPSPQRGKVERLLGEVEVGLGRSADGVTRLERAMSMLRTAYGDDHPATRQAELALAHQRALPGTNAPLAATALTQLDALAGLPDDDIELRKVAWLARAYAAQLRCHGPQRPQALRQLQQLDTRLRQARPEGGALSRDVAAIRAGCGLPAVERTLAAD